MLFLLKYWKQLVLAIVLVVSIGSYTYIIYSRGYSKAEDKYEQRIKEYEQSVIAKINDIQSTSFILYKNYEEMKLKSSKDFKAILEAAKNKPMFIYQNGDCTIAPNFTESFNQSIERANR